MRRTALWIPMAAVALATAVLWIAFGLQNEVQHEIDALLDRIGASVFYLFPTDHSRIGDDALAQFASLPFVSEAGGEGSSSTTYIPDEEYTLTYFEVSAGYFDVMRLPLVRGVAYSADDSHVAVLGAEVARVVFGDEDPIGQKIDGLPIVGVLDEIPADDSIREWVNQRILVPAGSAPNLRFGGRAKPYWAIWIRASGPIDDAIQAVEREFPDWTVRRASKRYENVFSMEASVNRLLVFSSAGLFVLAGTIVSGTLSLSSLSRRSEIGVRLAVGARGGDIARLLIADGLQLTIRAGLLGVLAGMLAFPLAELLGFGLRLGVSHLAIVPLILVVGVLSSLIPGWANARLSPVRAMSFRGGSGGRRGLFGGGFLIVSVSAAIGAGALYVLLSLGAATNQYLDGLLGDVDERTLYVAAPRQSILSPPQLMADDAEILAQIPELDLVVPVSMIGGVKLSGSDALGRSLHAVGSGYATLHYLPIVAGRDLTAEEIESGTRSALLSVDAAQAIFGDEIPLGSSLSANGKRYTVVGLFASNQLSVSRGMWTVVPFRSYSDEQRDFDAHAFWVRVAPGSDVDAVVAEVRGLLKAEYPDRADVEIVSPAAGLGDIRATLSGIALRLGLLIAGALFLGAANTFNLIQFHLALQRRELGIRRAIGGADSSIMWLGGRQGLRVAVLAAALGLTGGVFTANAFREMLQLPMAVAANRNLALAISAIVALGLLAGAAAGKSATKGSPADALRRGRE